MNTKRNALSGLLFVSVLALCFVWPIPNGMLPFHRNVFIYLSIALTVGLFFTSSSARQHLNIPKIKPVMLFIWLLTFFILINGFIVAPDIKEMIGT